MTPATRRAAAWIGIAFLFASFWAAAPWSDYYTMQYGTFLLSRGELALKLNLVLFILPATVLVAYAWADLPRNRRNAAAWFDSLGLRASGRGWPIGVAVVVLAAAAVIRAGVLHYLPITDDEHVYLFQAKLLASGRLFADSAPQAVRAFFDNQFIVNNGRWYGLYFMGHSAVLAMAMKLGLVEWTGGISSAFTVILAVAIARRVFDERVAILGAVLLLFSPFLLFVSATQLSQPTSALWLALFIYSALRIEDEPRRWAFWATAAAAVCAAVLTRPQSGIALSSPFLFRIAYLLAKGRLQSGWVAPAIGAAVCAAGTATFFALNYALTGSMFKTGYHAYLEQGNVWLAGFGPFYTLREVSQNLSQINFWLYGWPVSLVFVPWFRRSGRSVTLAAVAVAPFICYGFAAVSNITAVGPVYYTEVIVPLTLLTASGFTVAVEFVRCHLADDRALTMLLLWPRAAIAGALLTFFPLQAFSLSLMADVAREPYLMVEKEGLHNAVVFVESLPAMHRRPWSWAYFHRNNSPDLSDDVLYVKDLGPEKNRLLIDYLPQRKPYRMWMDGDRLRLEPIIR
jgi:hypothetical protein